MADENQVQSDAPVDPVQATNAAAGTTDESTQAVAATMDPASAESPLTRAELDAVLEASGLGEADPAFATSEHAEASDDELNVSPYTPPPMERGSSHRPSDEESRAIELINDVSLDVKVELGRSRMLVEDVLRLGAGSVVELDKLAGDPVDIFVNERLVAKGEVLVLNDDFCVRISEIITPTAEFAEG